jgi:protein SCO1/2
MYLTVFSKNKWIVLMVFVVAGCAAATKERSLPYFNTPDFTPVFLSSPDQRNSRITHTIDAFSFDDQDGNKIGNDDVNGRIHVANFIFTSCGSICPKMTSGMNKISDAFAKDAGVVLLSFSVTPWVDTKEVLKRYKDGHNISNPNWHFLTGEKAAIYQLARRSYFAEEDLGYTKDSSEFLHTEHFILVDRSQRIRGIYNGTLDLDMQNLIKDIQTLKKEGN